MGRGMVPCSGTIRCLVLTRVSMPIVSKGLTLLALLALLHWFFGNLYEAVVISPNAVRMVLTGATAFCAFAAFRKLDRAEWRDTASR